GIKSGTERNIVSQCSFCYCAHKTPSISPMKAPTFCPFHFHFLSVLLWTIKPDVPILPGTLTTPYLYYRRRKTKNPLLHPGSSKSVSPHRDRHLCRSESKLALSPPALPGVVPQI